MFLSILRVAPLLLARCNPALFVTPFLLLQLSAEAAPRQIVITSDADTILSDQSLQFYAAWEGSVNIWSAQESVHWSVNGCGKIIKQTGMYYPPKEIDGESCTATVKAEFIDDASLNGETSLIVVNHREPAAPATSPASTPATSLIEVNPANRTILSNESLQLSAYWNAANNSAPANSDVNWSMTGCGKVLKQAGVYYPPKDMPQNTCTAKITASLIDRPNESDSAVVTVIDHRSTAGQPAPTPVKTNNPPVTNQPPASGTLAVYPAIPQYQSDRFSVSVSQNGQAANSFVYKSMNADTGSYDYKSGFMQEANHWTTFSFSGSAEVTASRSDGKTIRSCVVRPLSAGITPIISGNKCNFTIHSPRKLSIEIDENFTKTANVPEMKGAVKKYVVKHPLFVFADPMESNVPAKSSDSIHYFGPGVHTIGAGYALKDGDHVYVAGGAYVKGTFINEGGFKAIRFSGRGIISGIGMAKNTQYGSHLIHMAANSGSKFSVEGITFTDSPRAGVETNASSQINGIKIFSWYSGSDGVKVGRNSTIENSFIKVNDDAIKMYNSNLVIRNNVLWQMTKGAAFQFGWQTVVTVRNVKVSNIDVIHSDAFTDYFKAERSDNQPYLRSSKAVFSCMGILNSEISEVVFDGVRVEDKGLLRLIGMRLVSYGPGDRYWGNLKPDSRKMISGIAFRNIEVAKAPYKQNFLYANKGGSISNISFENFSVNGVKSRGTWDMTSVIDGAGFTAVENVSNIFFID